MRLLTVRELSQVLNIKTKTLYQWAELGQIPCLKLNGTVRFDEDDIKAWIRSCCSPGVPGYNPLTKLEAQRKGGQKN